MRIQCAHRNRATPAVDALQEIVHQPDLAHNGIGRQHLRHTFDRCVQRDVSDAESAQGSVISFGCVAGGERQNQLPPCGECGFRQMQHHGKFSDATALGQNLRMAWKIVPGKMQGLLVQRGSDNRINGRLFRQRDAASR